MKAQAVNKYTGEVITVKAGSYQEIIEAWRLAQEYERMVKSLKDQLKILVPLHVPNTGVGDEVNGYLFRVSNVQRMNYDKSVLRRTLDEDVLDLLLIPHKPTVDAYIKEHLSELGEASTEIRKNMLPEGEPYQVIKLEKVRGFYEEV